MIIRQSNTAISLLAAFGADTPFEILANDDNDMLFKITVKHLGDVKLDTFNHGKKHHSSELPQEYLNKHRIIQPIPGQQVTFNLVV